MKAMLATATQNREIIVGVGTTVASFGLMEFNALCGSLLAIIGICYTLRKWYLMEKNKKDMSRPPFNKK